MVVPPNPVRSKPADSRRWLMLALLVAARTTMGFQFQSIAALESVLVSDLAIDYALLGALVGLYMLPGVVFALPGGLLGQRFGDKRITVLGLALMALGGAWFAAGDTFVATAAGRLLSGICAVLLTIHVAKMTADWFAGREMVVAMALLLSSWPLGIGLALLVLPPIAAASSGAVALMATAAVCAVGMVLVLAGYRTPPELPPQLMTLRFQLSRFEWGLSILSGTVWGLFNVGFILVLTFGPSFLTAQGYRVAEAGATVSLVTWAILVSLPLGGMAAERLKRPDAIMAGSTVAMAAAIALLPSSLAPAVLLAAVGLFAGPPAGLFMKLPTEVLKAKNRAAGMGVFFACFFLAMAGLVPVAGLLRDATGSPSAPLFFAAATLLGALASLGLFRAIQRRSPA